MLALAALNAAFETGLPSPLDDALLSACRPDLSQLRKCAEIPFDFTRKRVSTILEGPAGRQGWGRGGQTGKREPAAFGG